MLKFLFSSKQEIFLFFLLTNLFAYCQTAELKSYSQFDQLSLGENNVGFKYIEYIDSTEVESQKSLIENLPVQIGIWYPTKQEWSEQTALKFQDFFYLTERKNDFRQLTKQEKDSSLNIYHNFVKYGLKKEVSKDQIINLGRQKTVSILNADIGDSKYPVILAGHDGGIWKMSMLCEFLASHGFVVISSGPSSAISRLYSDKPQLAINQRIRTFEQIYEMINEIEVADRSNIGLMGLNGDSMPILLFQMKNNIGKAVVSIDGWEGKNNGSREIKRSPYYSVENLQIPLLEFHQFENPSNVDLHLNSSFFDSISNADKFSFVLKNFGHAYLTGNLVFLPDLEKDVIKKHEFWFNQIILFFKYYLKNEEDLYSQLFMENSSILEENEFNRRLIKSKLD